MFSWLLRYKWEDLEVLPFSYHDEEKYDEDKKFLATFSNWYSSNFTLEEQNFTSVQQWLVWSRGRLFNDETVCQRALETHDPQQLEELSLTVNKFDQSKWEEVLPQLLERALKAKFTQNPQLANHLLMTWGKTLANASPDPLWGTGCRRGDGRVWTQSEWPGKNLLGSALMKLRQELAQAMPFCSPNEQHYPVGMKHLACLSNQYPAKFTINQRTFSSVEQWMMWNLAVRSGEYQLAGEVYPEFKQKVYPNSGLEKYNDDDWKAVRLDILHTGLRAKFDQNPELAKNLLQTEDLMLVFSLADDDWGVKFNPQTDLLKVQQEANWDGENLLGKALIKVRDQLKEKLRARQAEMEEEAAKVKAEQAEAQQKAKAAVDQALQEVNQVLDQIDQQSTSTGAELAVPLVAAAPEVDDDKLTGSVDVDF